jgi:hypothetical protein
MACEPWEPSCGNNSPTIAQGGLERVKVDNHEHLEIETTDKHLRFTSTSVPRTPAIGPKSQKELTKVTPVTTVLWAVADNAPRCRVPQLDRLRDFFHLKDADDESSRVRLNAHLI